MPGRCCWCQQDEENLGGERRPPGRHANLQQLASLHPMNFEDLLASKFCIYFCTPKGSFKGLTTGVAAGRLIPDSNKQMFIISCAVGS